MKKFFVFAAFAVLALTSATVIKPITYTVDASKSTFKWTGKKVTGQHWGYIKFSNGTITTDGTNLTGGSFTVDMNSIDCQDIPADKGADKLVGHLKADDFFGTAAFPTSNLVIKSATSKGGGQFDITADLTIKGITSEIMFPAAVTMDGKALTAKAAFKVDRTKFGIKYGSASFFDKIGDKAISNDFEVEIDLSASNTAPAAASIAPAAAPVKKKVKKAKKTATAVPAPAKG
jgi:polyisoprenoid-binding protein YceI